VFHEQGDWLNDNGSRDVFCATSRLVNLAKIDPTQEWDTLVLAGEDWRLSAWVHFIQPVRGLFKRILYEAKDIHCNWVQAIPMGLNTAYILRCGGGAVLDTWSRRQEKTRLIGSAFGSKWANLNKTIPDRADLLKTIREGDLIENFFCEPSLYFGKLAEYMFFASPLGNGIQTPKICEAILCETIPVVTDHPCHRDLRDIYKIPLLIVKRWSDLSESMLLEALARFEGINWDEEKRKFLVKDFRANYLTIGT
jgi:hypothetical protein